MFWKNFLELCKINEKKPTAVITELGFSRGSVTNWKKGAIPQETTLLKISDYFGVTVDDLLSNKQKINTFVSYSSDEKQKEQTKELLDNLNEAKTKEIEEPKQQLYALDSSRVHMVPLFESVSAGFGALAINDVLDYVPLYFTSPIEASETICIKVHGDSMSPKIEDGDIIQVHKQDSVDSGSLAVVLVDGDNGLVKKVVYGETWIELQSINHMYKPMRFNGPDVERVRVVGLVKKIIKDV